MLYCVLALAVALSAAPIMPAHAASVSFQLPWQTGAAWVMVGGFSMGDGRDDRPASSPHNWRNGGALDLAPHNDMKIGEDTSSALVFPIAPGNIKSVSACYVRILHDDGVTTSEYYHLDGVDRAVIFEGARVEYSTKLGFIANNISQATCSGGDWKGPHLHLTIRPQMEGVNLSGWVLKYDHVNDRTSMTRGGEIKYLFQPILKPEQSSNNGGPARLQLSQGLSLSTTAPAINQGVSATFKVRNVGGQPMTLQTLTAGARRGTDWNGVNVDFPAATNIILQPGQEYIFQQSRSFDTAGAYFAEPVVQIDGQWGGISDANGRFSRVNFNVTSTPPSNVVFDGGSSKLWQDKNWGRANLTITAKNLNGQNICVHFWRAGRDFGITCRKATSNQITFYDLDGSGPMNRTTYYSQTAINQNPKPEWPAPNCAGPTQGQGLCDKITRP